MAHAQKPYFVFRRNGWVHLNRWGRQSSRILAAEVWASAVVMLDKQCSEVVWRVLATHSIRQFPLHFPFRASPCATTFQLESSRFMVFVLSFCSFSDIYATKLKDIWIFHVYSFEGGHFRSYPWILQCAMLQFCVQLRAEQKGSEHAYFSFMKRKLSRV